MNKVSNQKNLHILFLREGDWFVAYSPALDLSTAGKTFKEARNRFVEAVEIFFEEITKRGTVPEALTELGWQRRGRSWQPPVVVSQHDEVIEVPLVA